MGTAACNTTSTPREETTISHLDQRLPAQALRPIASLSTHPLISVAAAAYVLALLYLPRHLLSLLLSPVSLTTLLLLLAALLYLGASSPAHPQQEDKQQLLLPCPPCSAAPTAAPKTPPSAPGSQKKPVFSPESRHHFVDWARRGPLEVIYEEYEGEVEDEDLDENSPVCSRSPGRTRRLVLLEGIESLGMCCYTDDSDEEDSSSDSPAWDSQEDHCFRWEVEDDGLIEIVLEEDNLIEIDISACR